MKRLIALFPMLLLAAPATAQQAPEPAQMDLWCGLAFTIVSRDVPPDVTPEQQAAVDQFVVGAEMLMERAAAAHLEAGFTTEGFEAHRAALEPEVALQVTSSQEEDADYSFEQCAGLLGL